MTEQELKHEAREIVRLFKNKEVTDEEIICRIKDMPEIIHIKLPSTANLFLESVLSNRFQITKVLVEMGSDIHLKCKPSLIAGNVLNVAHSSEQADYLLGLGIEIEKNISMKEDFVNPLIMAVQHNQKDMVFYWLHKQKVLFAEDEEFIKELICATIYQITIMNQWDMIACIMADDELYPIMKDIYSEKNDISSIKLVLASLRRIKEEALESKKKELRKILNERKKKLEVMEA